MTILIDGYNLLHATGILGRGLGPGGLERARRALLGFLAASLSPDESAATTVVFDAKDPPANAPSRWQQAGLTVQFARNYEDADALIRELIRRDSAPRRMIVVSSDQGVRIAARRRRAQTVTSEAWYDQLLERRRHTAAPASEQEEIEPAKPPTPLSISEIEQWLSEFGDVVPESAKPTATPVSSPNNDRPATPPLKPGIPTCDEVTNPFPEEYVRQITMHDLHAQQPTGTVRSRKRQK